MMTRELKLIPIENIPTDKRAPAGLYVNTLRRFVEMEDKLCYIEFDDRVKARNACIGLVRNIKRLKLDGILVRQIGDRLYLEKIGGREK